MVVLGPFELHSGAQWPFFHSVLHSGRRGDSNARRITYCGWSVGASINDGICKVGYQGAPVCLTYSIDS